MLHRTNDGRRWVPVAAAGSVAYHQLHGRSGGEVSSRVWLRRAYEAPTGNDGARILVDRVWPRGVSKDDLHLAEWCKDVAPSTELRKWFGHDPERWDEFQERYRMELADCDDVLDALVERTRAGRVTLVYGARDTEHNQAVVLRQVVEERRDA